MNVSIYVSMSLCIYVALALCISYVSVRVTFRRSKRSPFRRLKRSTFRRSKRNPDPLKGAGFYIGSLKCCSFSSKSSFLSGFETLVGTFRPALRGCHKLPGTLHTSLPKAQKSQKTCPLNRGSASRGRESFYSTIQFSE